MKPQLIFFLLAVLFLNSCKKETDSYVAPLKQISACGMNDPLNDLKWLNELANKSKVDKSGNYQGNIWIKNYLNNDVIITDFALNSGGIAFHTFNCDGSSVLISDLSFFNGLTNDNKIYTSIK